MSSRKSKNSFWGHFRRVSDKTKALLKTSSGSGSQQSLDQSSAGVNSLSPESRTGSRPQNNSNVHLSPATQTRTQTASASAPDLVSSGSTRSASGDVGPVVDRVPCTVETEPAGTSNQPINSWGRLEVALKALHLTTKVFPPLQSAIGTLISCLELIQVTAKNSQDYDGMASELEGLATQLDKHLRENGTTSISDSLANVLQSIETEIGYINERRTRSLARGIFEAKKDENELIQCYRRIEGLFRRLQTNISLSTWSIANEHLANTRLESLTPAKLASYDSTLATDINRRTCTENTRTAILSEMNGWTSDPEAAKVYWMNGMAGTGKTTIAYSLAKSLERRKQLGASFFCTRTSPECRTAKRIVPTIAYQLARYSHPFQAGLCRAIKEDPDIGTRQVSRQFEHLLVKPLIEAEEAMPNDVVVVIDALDECEDGESVQEMLGSMFEHAMKLPLKFFITSRPEPEIQNEVKSRGDESRFILHLHEIEHSLVQADIELYLREELAFMSLSELQVRQLAQLAGNFFIYAATMVRYIRPSRSKKAGSPRERLKAVLGIKPTSTKQHAEIDDLYMAILEAVLNESSLEIEEMDHARLVLWTAVCAREPVTVGTLAALTGLDAENALMAVQSFGSVLHISEANGLVSTLHASFPDFIFTRARAQQFFCDEQSHAYLLAQRCFEVMKLELQFNICKLESSFDLDEGIEDLEERIKKYISRPLFYACRYWADHLSTTVSADNLCVMFEEFLLKQLLFWMEVLNLNKVNAFGTFMLRKIQPWLQGINTSTSRSCDKLVSDAEALLTRFSANPVSLSTPHIYISALPFFRRASPALDRYWRRTQGLIDVGGTAMEDMGSAPLASWSTGDEVKSIALSPDGKFIAFGGGRASYRLRHLKWDGTGHFGVIDRYTGRFVVGPFQAHTDLVRSVSFSPDGMRIVSASHDNTICVWNTQDGKRVSGPFTGHTGPVRSAEFAPDGTRIVTGSADMAISVWNAINGELIAGPFQAHTKPVNSAVFSPDGTRIASGSDDMTIFIWGMNDDAKLLAGPLKGHTGAVRSLAFNPDGACVISGSADKTICIWDSRDGRLVAGPIEGHTDEVRAVAFSADGTRIISGSNDRTICVWNSRDSKLVAGPFKGHTGAVTSVAFSRDDAHIVSGSDDTTICVWSAQYGNVTDLFKGHSQPVSSAAFSPDGTRIVSGSDDETICIWNAHDGKLVAGPSKEHTGAVTSVAFSPDGTLIGSGSQDNTVCVWSVQDGKPVAGPFKAHTDWVTSVAFSPDSTYIVSGSDDRTVCVWNAQDGKLVSVPLKGHMGYVTSVAFSPDGTRVVSGSEDKSICVWNPQDGMLVAGPFKRHTGSVMSVAFSPDCTCIASGSTDKTICVWNAQDGKLVAGPFKRHTEYVTSVAFSPDGTRIVSGSSDKTICVWNVQDGKLVAGPFKGHTKAVRSVAYSPDGTCILSCSHDCSIRITNLPAINPSMPALDGDWDLKSDGWVVNGAGQHLFWVPQHLHPSLPRPYQSFALGPQGSLQIDYNNILIGERWSECYVGE